MRLVELPTSKKEFRIKNCNVGIGNVGINNDGIGQDKIVNCNLLHRILQGDFQFW